MFCDVEFGRDCFICLLFAKKYHRWQRTQSNEGKRREIIVKVFLWKMDIHGTFKFQLSLRNAPNIFMATWT